MLKSAEVPKKVNITSILSSITDVNTIVYFHEKKLFVTVNTYSPPTSSIAQSDAESTGSGPRDVLTESLQSNLSLIKRRIKNTNLKSRDSIVGTETNTKLAVIYLETIVNQDNLDSVFKNIDTIEQSEDNR